MDLLVTDQESDESLSERDSSPETMDAGAQLDSILASGRTPNPMDSRELPAHMERIRRRVAETPPPPSAASGAAQGRSYTMAPPISDLEGTPMEGHRPDDSLTIVLLVAVLAVIAGFLGGQLAAMFGVTF